MKKYMVFRRSTKYGVSFDYKFSSDSKQDAMDYATIMNRNKADDEDKVDYIVVIELEPVL